MARLYSGVFDPGEISSDEDISEEDNEHHNFEANGGGGSYRTARSVTSKTLKVNGHDQDQSSRSGKSAKSLRSAKSCGPDRFMERHRIIYRQRPVAVAEGDLSSTDVDLECCETGSSSSSSSSSSRQSDGQDRFSMTETSTCPAPSSEMVAYIWEHTQQASSSRPRRPQCSPMWARMLKDGRRAQERAKSGGPAPQYLEDGTPITARYWGISKTQLRLLHRYCQQQEDWDPNDSAAVFVEKFVKPATEGTHRGVALNLNTEVPLEVDLMISHAWSESIGEFFEDVLNHMHWHEVAYICFLANYQGTPEEIDLQLGKDIYDSPFTQVISNSECERMLVVPNEFLRGTGQGLYSRLWCDLEIKCAADEGVPICIIKEKNTEAYLLGSSGASSRDARCGDPSKPMNADEKLIRHGIETMPPETARSHSVAVCFAAVIAAFSPIIFVVFVLPNGYGWMLGLVTGLALGLAGAMSISKCIRPYRRDGYQVVDKVIRGAALGHYDHRRARTKDFWFYAVYGFSMVLLEFVVRIIFFPFSCALLNAVVGGLSGGVWLWSILHINNFGSWTGTYILEPRSRIKWGCVLLFTTILGPLVYPSIFGKTTIIAALERGAFSGWLIGLICLSAWHGRRWHAVNFAFMLTVLSINGVMNAGLSQELFLLVLGFGTVQVRPEWGLRNRIVICTANILVLVAMLWLGEHFQFATFTRLEEHACRGENDGYGWFKYT